MKRLTPFGLVDWAIAVALSLMFVSCGVDCLLRVLR